MRLGGEGAMIIVHAGIHKTGSTAIQAQFGARDEEGLHYLAWRDDNHSDLAVLLFDDAPEKYWVFEREGRGAEEMRAWRDQVAADLARDIAANEGKIHLMSAERLAGSTPDAIARMKAFFAPLAGPVRVVIYVRPAAEYMTSMAQQYVRTGTMDIRLIWPQYRGAVEKFDLVFGRENVDVRVYNPMRERGWDVVADFCGAIGLGARTGVRRAENVGMGARHLALVLERRVAIGHGPRTPQEAHEDHLFLTDVLGHPSPRFVLDPEMLQAEIAAHQDDLDWIEARLGGVSMARVEPVPRDAVVFGSTQDVLDYAAACRAVDAGQARPLVRMRRFAGRIKWRMMRMAGRKDR